MLKVWARAAVCVCVRGPLLRRTDVLWPSSSVMSCDAEMQPGPAVEGEAATAGVPHPQEKVGGGGHPSPGYHRPVHMILNL